jgi:hypothetical protein
LNPSRGGGLNTPGDVSIELLTDKMNVREENAFALANTRIGEKRVGKAYEIQVS